jgi:hypothetical protein
LLNDSSNFHVFGVGFFGFRSWSSGVNKSSANGSLPMRRRRVSFGEFDLPGFLGLFASWRIVTKYERQRNGVFLACGGSEVAIFSEFARFLGSIIYLQDTTRGRGTLIATGIR